MTLAAVAARMLARTGDTTATLARESEGTTVTLKARRIGGTVETIGGGTSAQQNFRVKIGRAELAASAWSVKAPARGDTLTIDGIARTVLDARPIKEGATVGLYELEVAG